MVMGPIGPMGPMGSMGPEVKWGRLHGNEAYAILGHFGAHSIHFLGPLCSFWGGLCPFGVILGPIVPFWGHFGADSPLLGSFWGDLGPF